MVGREEMRRGWKEGLGCLDRLMMLNVNTYPTFYTLDRSIARVTSQSVPSTRCEAHFR